MITANFANERLMLAGQCVAIGELAYREARRYAKERIAFGKPIIDLSGRDVETAFPDGGRINVRFQDKRIDITPAPAE